MAVRYIFILITFLSLYSCSGYYHIKKAEKHTQKAINKGVEPSVDTTYITTSDTLTEVDTVDNYIRITKTIRDTLRIEGKKVYIAKSRAEVRQEQKTERVKVRQEEKTERAKEKQKTKQVKKAAKKRSLWLFWTGLFVGIGIMIIFRVVISKLTL